MSGESGNVNSTFLDLGWTSSHITVGSGYDYGTRQLRTTALAEVKTPEPVKGDQDIDFNIHSISTVDELKTRIKADFKANVPLEGMTVSTENSYLSSVETSETTLTRVIQQTHKDPPVRLDLHNVRLSEDARKILEEENGWKRFSDRYGQYFVYGYKAQARFSAVCTIKTNSKETRDEIKTSLEVGVEKAGSLSASLESLKETKRNNVSIDVNVEFKGIKGLSLDESNSNQHPDDGNKKVGTNQIEKVQEMYDNFKKNFKTQPHIGLLCHYSALDTTGKIPLPQNQFAHLGPDLERMYKGLYTAQIDISNSPMAQAAETGRQIRTLCENIMTLKLTDEEAIRAMDKNVTACLLDVDKWRLRNDLIEDVKKLKNTSLPGDWSDAGYQKEWASGILNAETNSKYGILKDDVTSKSEHFRESSWFAHYNERTFDLGENDKIVIGFKITSWWNDDTNGTFKVYSGNVLDSMVKVGVSSYKTRGCDWNLDVWMVPKLMYAKKES